MEYIYLTRILNNKFTSFNQISFMKLFFTFVLFCSSNMLIAQNDSLNDIDFVINKIKNTYAGYADKEKGKEFEELIKEVKASNSKDTFANLSKLTLYFNDAHLRLFQELPLQKIDTNICAVNLRKVEKLLLKRKQNKYSGYWASANNNTIIYLNQKDKSNYEAFIVETKTKLPKGFCNVKMQKNKNGELITNFVSTNMRRFFLKFKFANDTTLMGNAYSKWRKISDYKEGFLDNKTVPTSTHDFKVLDSNNVVLYMPSFIRSRVAEYDSIIKVNKEKIINSKNLIIDLRYNGGGSIRNYFSLFPIICTNAIWNRQDLVFADQAYIGRLEKIKLRIDSTKDSERIMRFQNFLDTAKSNFGKYFTPQKTIAWDCKDTTQNNVKNVAIITNYGCLSAAEMLVLHFKQSKKVTTFGEATGGAIDYPYNKVLFLPQSKLEFWIVSSNMTLNEENPSYDKTGIKPDIEISDDEPDWIAFVKKYYEKK
jgi:hypothetical protein